MRLLLDDNWDGDCGGSGTTISIAVPSALPPWSRPPYSPLNETITSTMQSASLNCQTTFLSATQALNPVANYTIILGAGTYVNQTKMFVIPNATPLASTQPWSVTGTFVGGTSLLLNSVGPTAILFWDGAAWQLVGGNAELKP